MKNILIIILLFSVCLNLFFIFKNTWKDSIDKNIEIEKNIDKEKEDIKNWYYTVSFSEDTKNLWEEMNSAFKDVNNLEQFIQFDRKYNSIYYFILLVKSWDKENSWKYLQFLLQDKNVNLNSEEKEYVDNFFENVFAKKEIIPNSEDWDFDFSYYFSTLPFEDAINQCKTLAWYVSYPNFSLESCEEKITLYRATKENKYCEKISDSYKAKLCNDFLDYIDKK